MSNQVFISYSREDQTYARNLANDLRKRRFDVWIDDRIDCGDRWWQTIVQAVRASAAFVVVMTPAAETSEWVEREIMLAQREGKLIFPLLLRDEVFPLLITMQYVDVTDGRMPPQDFYNRLRQVSRALDMPESVPPRPEPERKVSIPVPEVVPVPAGPFTMGTRREDIPALVKKYGGETEWYEQEVPQYEVNLPAFEIGRYPVTNREYQAFIRGAGYRPPAYWEGDEYPPGKGDHPVVNVTWRDAVAYCRWLNKQTGRSFRLPTEAEWEKAARGSDRRQYPWGDEFDPAKCNIREGGPGGTTPVGQYPEGASPYDILDMAGNVWEWCSSLYKSYPYDPGDGRENPEAEGSRVLRGGAFNYEAGYVRCACRYGCDPGSCWGGCGFRVVASPVHL